MTSTQRSHETTQLLSSDQKLNHEFVTYDQREMVETINHVFLCQVVSLFGIGANIINIIVFFKQGFSYTVNVSFCGLAFSDLCCLIMQILISICSNPILKHSEISFDPLEVEYLIGGVPSVCFCRITSWITVYITAERCLGVAIPLKVKQIVTLRKTTAAIVSIYLLNFLTTAPEYVNFSLDWKYSPEKNRTIFGMVVKSSNAGINKVVFMLMTVTGLMSIVSVIVFTSFLVFKLAQKSAWRKMAVLSKEQSDSNSIRDKKTMKIVVLIAGVMIACYTPGTVFTLVSTFMPEFSVFGRYTNLYFSLWSFAFLLQEMNSSVNIFLYYTMSTKYRQTFLELLATCTRAQNKQISAGRDSA